MGLELNQTHPRCRPQLPGLIFPLSGFSSQLKALLMWRNHLQTDYALEVRVVERHQGLTVGQGGGGNHAIRRANGESAQAELANDAGRAPPQLAVKLDHGNKGQFCDCGGLFGVTGNKFHP